MRYMLLTIDIGTSTFKSALWNYDGICLSYAAVPIKVNENNGFLHEVNPSLWLNAFEESCRKLKSQTEHFKDVEVIVISGNGPSLVPVLGEPSKEKFYVPAENARLWLDRRAAKYREKVSQAMGGFVDVSFFLPKILFIKNDENELYNKTKVFLGCPEYLTYALTAEARTVFPSDGFDRWFWNNDVLEKLELDVEKFPAFIRPGDQFGTLIPSVCEHFGFAKNIPVISGGPDFFAAILGSGVTEPGQACDRTGSSEGINLCTQKRIIHESLMSYGHPIKPHWNLSGIINTTGSAIKWCCDLFEFGFDDLIKTAQKSKPGSGGLIFHPYLAGERAHLWDSTVRAQWSGINLSSGKCDLANSVLEGIGFSIRDVITEMESSGEKINQLHVTGKLSGCKVLNQLKADITGKEILEGPYKEAELLGLAVIGSCFKGKYSSFKEASSALVKIEKHYEPNPKNTELYNDLFEKYIKKRN